MARPPATAEQRRQARNAIRQAAAEVAAECGAASVTARKVATRAGVSVGTLYSHFDNLSALLRSLWTPIIAEADHELAAVAEAYRDPIERVRAILGEYAALVASNEVLHRNTLLFVRPQTSEAPAQLPPNDLAFHRLLVEAIREGQDAGAMTQGDPVQLAQVLWAGVHGALALPVNSDLYELEPAAQQVDLMIDLLVASLSSSQSSSQRLRTSPRAGSIRHFSAGL